jgi:hypothetical protein
MQSQSQSHSQPHPPPSAAQLARLAEKKKEFEAVEALQRASALFLRRLESLADDCEAMADAGIGASPSTHTFFFSLLISYVDVPWRSKPLIAKPASFPFFIDHFYTAKFMAKCSRSGRRCSKS